MTAIILIVKWAILTGILVAVALSLASLARVLGLVHPRHMESIRAIRTDNSCSVEEWEERIRLAWRVGAVIVQLLLGWFLKSF